MDNCLRRSAIGPVAPENVFAVQQLPQPEFAAAWNWDAIQRAASSGKRRPGPWPLQHPTTHLTEYGPSSVPERVALVQLFGPFRRLACIVSTRHFGSCRAHAGDALAEPYGCQPSSSKLASSGFASLLGDRSIRQPELPERAMNAGACI